MKRTITIFGSAIPTQGDPAYDDAFALGAALAAAGYVVCNGGYAGTMEASAKGASAAGGTAVGVTCTLFDRKPNEWIGEQVHTESLEDRLRTLVQRGDGYVVLPGGTGTLLELAYVLESMNKGFIGWRRVVLYGTFWEQVLVPLRAELRRERLEQIEKMVSVETTPTGVVGVFRRDG